MNDDMSAEMDADIGVFLAVDDQRGGDVDVGVIEVGKLGFPVLVVEFEEERAQDGRIVEWFSGDGGHVGRVDVRARLWPWALPRRRTLAAGRIRAGRPVRPPGGLS